jgi:hypothetical protein
VQRPLIPVRFGEKDQAGRVSLISQMTRAFLEEHGIFLQEGDVLRLCEPFSGGRGGRIEWRAAEATAVFDSQAGRWMAELQHEPLDASAAPNGHWAKQIPSDFLGPLAGRTLDLDLAAAEIERRRDAWMSVGVEVGPLTWQDRARGSPRQLLDRRPAGNADSLGVKCIQGAAELAVVLWRGGWADVISWTGSPKDAVEVSAPDVDTVAAFGELLDWYSQQWLASVAMRR